MTEEPDQIPIADVELSDDEIAAAVDVLESGQLVQGEQVSQFESSFADAVGADHAIAVSSGTAALHVAYLATVPEGASVLVPALSHIATASMVSFANATPLFCDVDSETYTLDLDSAHRRITDDTAAIAPVHLFGNVCDIDTIQSFADEHDLTVIWDAAQALGSTYDGHDVGSFDDIVSYSFYPTKNMTTTEGGMLTTDDQNLAAVCRKLRAHWQTEKYYHPDLGLNYRMTDVEGAIGRKQLEKLDSSVAARQDNARYLTDRLRPVDGVKPPSVQSTATHSYHQYTISIDLAVLDCTRAQFRESLADCGVDTAVHYPRALHEQPAFDTTVTLPTAERLCDRVCSLPVYPSLTTTELDRIASAVRATAADYRV